MRFSFVVEFALSGVSRGVMAVGNSVNPVAGDGASVFVPDRSVIAERGDRAIWLKGMAFSSFRCLRVFGIENE